MGRRVNEHQRWKRGGRISCGAHRLLHLLRRRRRSSSSSNLWTRFLPYLSCMSYMQRYGDVDI